MRKLSIFLAFWVFIIIPLWTQSSPQSFEDDPASFIGYSLEELISHFGVPRSVYPVRGLEEWDDDVVFVYQEGDFYIIKDRVWQIGLDNAFLIRAGDTRAAVLLRFGQSLLYGEDFVIYPLGGYHWPMAVRFNFDLNGRVRAIFIYRSDI